MPLEEELQFPLLINCRYYLNYKSEKGLISTIFFYDIVILSNQIIRLGESVLKAKIEKVFFEKKSLWLRKGYETIR